MEVAIVLGGGGVQVEKKDAPDKCSVGEARLKSLDHCKLPTRPFSASAAESSGHIQVHGRQMRRLNVKSPSTNIVFCQYKSCRKLQTEFLFDRQRKTPNRNEEFMWRDTASQTVNLP